MKRFLIILLLVAGLCSGATLLDESFEANGYENTWAETEGTSNVLDANSTSPAGIPDGTQCLDATMGGSAEECYALHDLGSGEAVVYGQFFVYVDDSPGTSNETYQCFTIHDGSSINCVEAYIVGTAGGPKLYVGGYAGGTRNSNVDLSLDTWYQIDFKYDSDADEFEWKLDGVSQYTYDSGSILRTGARYVYAGVKTRVSAYTTIGTTYVDNIRLDDTTWLSGPGGNIVMILKGS